MNVTWKLTLASLKMFVRNRQALFFSLFMPFFIMFIFGFIGFDKPPKIDVGLVTNAPNEATAAFVDQIKNFPAFTIHEGTLEEEQAQLNEGSRSAVLDVPDALLGSANQPNLVLYENAGQAGQAQTVATVINQMVDKMTIANAGAKPIFPIEERSVNAFNLRYIEFLLPGLIALSVMQMSVFSVAFLFTEYKEKGVLKRLLATPMKPFQFVAANGITRLIVSVLQALIFIAVGVTLFKVHVVGSYALVFLTVVLGAAMFLGLGFTISGLSKTVDTVPALANLIVFPMMFLGGTFFPLTNMPGWLQGIAKFLPLTYFSTPLRDIMTKGAGLTAIWPSLLGMVVWGVILLVLASFTFRFQEREAA